MISMRAPAWLPPLPPGLRTLVSPSSLKARRTRARVLPGLFFRIRAIGGMSLWQCQSDPTVGPGTGRARMSRWQSPLEPKRLSDAFYTVG
jgi:hypothetical protein